MSLAVVCSAVAFASAAATRTKSSCCCSHESPMTASAEGPQIRSAVSTEMAPTFLSDGGWPGAREVVRFGARVLMGVAALLLASASVRTVAVVGAAWSHRGELPDMNGGSEVAKRNAALERFASVTMS